jgi:Na+/H+ antiporter NhaD/arsenite permease-like protein
MYTSHQMRCIGIICVENLGAVMLANPVLFKLERTNVNRIQLTALTTSFLRTVACLPLLVSNYPVASLLLSFDCQT